MANRRVNYKGAWVNDIVVYGDGTAQLTIYTTTPNEKYHDLKIKVDANNIRQLAEMCCKYMRERENHFKREQCSIRKAMNYGNTEAEVKYEKPAN